MEIHPSINYIWRDQYLSLATIQKNSSIIIYYVIHSGVHCLIFPFLLFWFTVFHLPLQHFTVVSIIIYLFFFLLSSLFQRTPSLCFLASLLALFLTGKNQWWHIPLLLSHCLSSGSGCFVMLDHHISDRYKVNCFSHLSATGSPTLCKLSIYLVCILSCFKGCEFCAIF